MEAMIPPSREGNGQEGLEALSQLVRESVHTPTPLRLDRGLQALTTRLEGENQGRSLRLPWYLVGATVACLALGVAITSYPRFRSDAAKASTLSYTIKNGSLVEGGYLRESGKAGVRLSFNEGTEFDLRPGTRGRLRSVDSTGARIAIEHGTASFQVTPGSSRRWLVDVGPFLVTVKGTIFTVSWDASTERFELNLQRGEVVVRGPVLGGDITLQGGQRIVADLPAAQTIISDPKSEQTEALKTPQFPHPAASAPSEAPSAPPAKTVTRMSTMPAPADTKIDSERRWPFALAAGEWDQILADAQRTGLKKTLDKAGSEDLIALANAARYRRRMDLARQALLAERRRFPESDRTLDATFLLGRVEESSERGTEHALRWYGEYLARAPGGTYASEALGRKMILTGKLQGDLRARPIAEEYLQRFPSGTYAGTARALSHTP